MMLVRHRERILRTGSRARGFGGRDQTGPLLNRTHHRHEIRHGLLFVFLRHRAGRFRFLRFLMGRRAFAFLRSGHLRRNDRRRQRALYRDFAVRFRKLEPLGDRGSLHLGLQRRIRLGFRKFHVQGFRDRNVRNRCENLRLPRRFVRNRYVLRPMNRLRGPGVSVGRSIGLVDVQRTLERREFSGLYGGSRFLCGESFLREPFDPHDGKPGRGMNRMDLFRHSGKLHVRMRRGILGNELPDAIHRRKRRRGTYVGRRFVRAQL